MRCNHAILLPALAGVLAAPAAVGEIVVRNALSSADNITQRDLWLADAGISLDQVKSAVDFESGFTTGQNISGVPGLFPAGLVIRDSSSAAAAVVRSNSFGGSRPVGTLSLGHNEQPFLELEFPEPGVDYLALQDIDHAGTEIIVHFADGSQYSFEIETTATSGDSAEFVGMWRNDRAAIVRVQLDASGDGQWGIDTILYGGPDACDPDVNCDGVPDQGDVACIILAVAGDMSCYCQADPDFNHDGVPDQGDVADLILAVAGAPCP